MATAEATGPLEQIFSLQDQLTQKLARAMKLDGVPGADQALAVRTGGSLAILRLLGTANNALEQSQDPASIPRAEALFRQVIDMAKDIPEAYLGLVRTLWHRREPGRKDAEINKEIKSHLEQAIKLRPDYYEAISLFGFLLWSEGNFDEAFSMQRRALRLKPSFAAGYYGLGLGYASNGKVDEALAMLRQASSLDPEDSEYRTQLGLYISVFKRDHARALKHMIRALDLPGVVSWNHTMLAYVQLMAGDAMSCLKTLSQSPTRGPLNKVHAMQSIAMEVACKCQTGDLKAAGKLWAKISGRDRRWLQKGALTGAPRFVRIMQKDLRKVLKPLLSTASD